MRARSQNNLRQMALSLHGCSDANGSVPPAVGFWNDERTWSGDYNSNNTSMKLATLFVFILPYVEQQAKFQAYTGGNCWNAGGTTFFNKPEVTPPPVYLNPADPSAPDGNRLSDGQPVIGYAANAAALGCKGWSPPGGSTYTFTCGPNFVAQYPKTFVDGTSNVIVFYERYAKPTPTSTPLEGNTYNLPYGPENARQPVLGLRSDKINLVPQAGVPAPLADRFRANSPFANTCQVALADGSVRGVSPTVTPVTWENAQRPADGTPLGTDW